MPSRFDRAVAVTQESMVLAVVPVVATLLSLSKVQQALATAGGGGITFPFPTGLPTLWSYVSLPGVTAAGGITATGPGALLVFVVVFLVGLLVTSALEAGFLGALDGQVSSGDRGFVDGIEQFTLRIVGVNLIRAAMVLVALPFLILPPIAIIVVIVLSYFIYGLSFVVVVRDVRVLTALSETLEHAADAGDYATFAVGHLVAGAGASIVLSGLVRNAGIVGILIGAVVVAVPAVFVAVYGVLLFRDLDAGSVDAARTDVPQSAEP